MKIASRLGGALLMLLAVLPAGCYESEAPLAPPSAGVLDKRLIGSWHCSQPQELGEKPFSMTVLPYDDKQYLAAITAEGEEPAYYRVYSSRLKTVELLNVQELAAEKPFGPKPWLFLRTSYPTEESLQIDLLLDKSLKPAPKNVAALRKAIDRLAGKQELFGIFCTCERIAGKK